MLGTQDGLPAVPAVLARLVEQVRSLATAEAHQALGASTPDERAGWVIGLQQLTDAVAVASLTAVAAFDARGDGQVLHGAASTPAWLRGAFRITGAEAAERVRLARLSGELLADPVEQVRSGTLTYEHLRAVERGVRNIPEDRQPAAVTVLTDLAKVTSVGDVRTAGRHLQYVVDPDGSLADTCHQFDRRYLTLAPLMDGMTSVDGLLDAESAALLAAAFAPFMVPSGTDDARTAAQRRADGLVQIVASAANHSLLATVGGERPHLQVIIDPRSSAPGAPAAASELAALPPARLPQAPGSPAFMHPLGVARIACDA